MKYLLGIDGGGTKTAYLLCDEQGHIVSSCFGPGCSYKQHGTQDALETIISHVQQCVDQAGISSDDISGCCIGLPCYGESPSQDQAFVKSVTQYLNDFPIYFVNDAVVGWAGSLALQPGINIVAGTGSIAYGADHTGNCARCGGWSWVFGDEGSCHWAGMKTMELFTKEADGRLPKGALYSIVREELSLEDDMAFTEIMEEKFCPYREKTAALQRWLCDAALAGDAAAKKVYVSAAEELALAVKGVAGQLSFTYPIRISYSGGIFRSGELILEPFFEFLPPDEYELNPPLLSPVKGAVLLAFRQFLPDNVENAIHTLQECDAE